MELKQGELSANWASTDGCGFLLFSDMLVLAFSNFGKG